MSTITKLNYLADTKDELKDKLNEHGANITDNDTFRSYVDKIKGIYNNWPKVTGEGTEITLTPTRKGRMQLDLKGNTSQDSTTGKNLIPTQISAWEQGTITNGINGTSTTRLRTADYYPIENDKDYCVSIQSTDYCFLNIWLYDSLKSVVGQYYNISNSINGATNKTINIPSSQIPNVAYMRVVLRNKTSSSTITTNELETIKPQVEEGSTATEWEPYTGGVPSPNPDYPQPIHVVTGNNTISIGNTDYPINLGSLELCKIGNYQDYLYKENGNWYKYEAIYKTIRNGTESWANGNYGTNSYYHANPSIKDIQSQAVILANLFRGVSYDDRARSGNNIIYFESGSNKYNEYVRDTNFSSVSAFTEYLSENNLILYYIKDTPTTTQITDETLISQLDAIENAMSTTDTTTITQTNSDLPFIISASALKKGGN